MNKKDISKIDKPKEEKTPYKIFRDNEIILRGVSYPRCQRIKHKDGQQCRNIAEPGYKYCKYHGGQGGKRRAKTPTGQNLSPGDSKLYNDFLAELRKDFGLDKSADRIIAENASYYYVRLNQEITSGASPDIITKWDRLLRDSLESLKVTRDKRHEPVAKMVTPAEWASGLLEEHRQAEIKSGANTTEKADGKE